MATCAGERRDGTACTTSVPVGTLYCYHHDPARAEERSRKASRAAKLKHDSIAKGIRKMHDDIHELIYLTATNELDPRVKSRLTEIVQLSQTYARLTELELAAGGKPERGSVLPDDLPELSRPFPPAEEARQAEAEASRSEMMALAGELTARGEMPEELAKVMAVTDRVIGW